MDIILIAYYDNTPHILVYIYCNKYKPYIINHISINVNKKYICIHNVQRIFNELFNFFIQMLFYLLYVYILICIRGDIHARSRESA